MKKRRTTPRKKWSFQDIVDAYNEWDELVEDGADPIEALHGHVCGPDCWHEQTTEMFRDIARVDRERVDRERGAQEDQ